MSTSRPAAPPNRTRSLVVFALKAVVAAVLIGWLIRGGALDFGKLGILFERPSLLFFDLVIFVVGLVAATLRWRALLGLASVEVPFGRLLQLQATAQFFNIVIPGNVGGDVVKALYVARDAQASKRTTILLIVFVERLLGLAGLVTLATLVVGVRGPALWSDPLLRPLVSAIFVLGAGTVLGPALFVVFMRIAGERLEAWTSGTTAIAKLLARLVAAMRLLSAGPVNLVAALGFSMIAHGSTMAFFTSLTPALSGQDVSYAAIATVFPLGILTMILPVSPAGLGVGHVAFDRLFSAIGVRGGATIFNVYLIGQIAPNLLGVFPYLGLKRSGALPDPQRDTVTSTR